MSPRGSLRLTWMNKGWMNVFNYIITVKIEALKGLEELRGCFNKHSMSRSKLLHINGAFHPWRRGNDIWPSRWGYPIQLACHGSGMVTFPDLSASSIWNAQIGRNPRVVRAPLFLQHWGQYRATLQKNSPGTWNQINSQAWWCGSRSTWSLKTRSRPVRLLLMSSSSTKTAIVQNYSQLDIAMYGHVSTSGQLKNQHRWPALN